MPTVIVPIAISIIMGSPVSSPCGLEPLPWHVVPASAPSGPPIASGVRLSYSVDGKVLQVFPPIPGRVFCSGFESYSVSDTIHSGARLSDLRSVRSALPPSISLTPSTNSLTTSDTEASSEKEKL